MKRLSKLLGVALALGMLTSSAPGVSAASQAGSGKFSWTAAKGQTINVLFNQHPYATAVIQQLSQFEKMTGITVKYQVVPETSYFTKLSIDLSARNSNIDAFMTGSYQLWGYATAGYMQNLSTYLNNPSWTSPSYDVKDFIPGVLAGDRWNLKVGSPVGSGSQWAVPMGFEEYPLTYNVKAFEKAGIKHPPTTLQELYHDAVKLKGWNGPGSYGIAVRGVRNWGTIHPDFMSLLANWGGSDFKIQNGHLVSQVNSPAAIKMTELWVNMVKKAGPPGWSNYDWYQNEADLGSGKAAMMYDADILGYWTNVPSASKESGNLRYALPPAGPNGQIGSNEWIWSLAMNNYSQHKLATWLFLQWATSKEHDLWGALHQGELMNPPRQSVWDNKTFIHYVQTTHPTYLPVFEELSKHLRIEFTPEPDFFNMATEWAATLQSIEAGQTTAKDGLDNLAQQINQEVKNIHVTGH